MTRADTIARLVNAYTDALGVALDSILFVSTSKNNEERARAQHAGRQAMEEIRQHLHLAFLETLGGAAVAGEAAGPWVVRATHPRSGVFYTARDGLTKRWAEMPPREYTSHVEAEADAKSVTWASDWTRTVLPLAEAERAEAAATLAGPPARTQKVLAELADEEPSADAALTERADLRIALRRIATTVGAAVSPEASTEMHCAVADEVRAVVEKLRAEVQRSREQKPVRWAIYDGDLFDTTLPTALEANRYMAECGALNSRIVPLYAAPLAPVVRDHSGVIVQIPVIDALRAALAALKGETK